MFKKELDYSENIHSNFNYLIFTKLQHFYLLYHTLIGYVNYKGNITYDKTYYLFISGSRIGG